MSRLQWHRKFNTEYLRAPNLPAAPDSGRQRKLANQNKQRSYFYILLNSQLFWSNSQRLCELIAARIPVLGQDWLGDLYEPVNPWVAPMDSLINSPG